MQRTFYDLGKVNYWGPQSKGKVDFQFDEKRKIAPAQMADWEAKADKARKMKERKAAAAAAKACGGSTEQLPENAPIVQERMAKRENIPAE